MGSSNVVAGRIPLLVSVVALLHATAARFDDQEIGRTLSGFSTAITGGGEVTWAAYGAVDSNRPYAQCHSRRNFLGHILLFRVNG